MNRTALFLVLAAGLALTALVLGLPAGPAAAPPPPGPLAPPAVTAAGGGSVTLAARLSHPVVPAAGRSDVFVTVDVAGARVPGAHRAPVNLALVIDRSGSMAGYKLQQARAAARQLVALLQPDDRLAIVHYGSDVRALPGLPATPENRARMAAFVDAIQDDGSTNIGAGLQEGARQLAAGRAGHAVHRLILMSDGQPTEGITEPAALAGLVRSMRTQGVTVSSLGVGTDFNEDLMQALAESGSGAYGFIEDAGRLAALFEKDLQQATTTVARGVELTLELPDGVELGEVLGYPARTEGRRVTVTLPDLAAGQQERLVARLSVAAGAAGRTLDVAGLRLRYTDLLAERPAEAGVALSALASDRREEVLARQDKEATVHAARARSAQNLERAAEALKDGRRAEAEGYLAQNRALFSEAAVVAGAPAIAADVAAQEEARQAFTQAQDADGVGAAVKKTKAEARRSYGKLGSTY